MADFVSSRGRDLKQSHDIRTKKKAAINNRNHVLIRLPTTVGKPVQLSRNASAIDVNHHRLSAQLEPLNHHCQVPRNGRIGQKEPDLSGDHPGPRGGSSTSLTGLIEIKAQHPHMEVIYSWPPVDGGSSSHAPEQRM